MTVNGLGRWLMASNTLHIIIDPSGAQRGSAQTVQAINSIVNATTNLNIQINQTNSHFFYWNYFINFVLIKNKVIVERIK